MHPIYVRLRERARQIVAGFPPPDFYRDHAQAYSYSRQHLNNDAVLIKLRRFVDDNLENDFGHGLHHAIKVTEDAGALMCIEGQAVGYSKAKLKRRIGIVQCAGLLHDIKRKQKDHARLGAEYARRILKNYPLKNDEIDDACRAIQNHEAFKEAIDIETPEGSLVSDCLYDADKFRWGPDNFTHTLWDMISFYNPPLEKFMARYPEGMAGLEKIKTTFRTETGKKYGPRFIDLGLAIGKELHDVILSEYSEYL
ncbi:MAG: HD domain-containing protein [Desulfobacterales bacterium]|nr:MAG: HD domain-containing protein [Desulfobacterales bacterium]